MLKLTGLWKNISTKGEEYFTGSMGSARIVIMKNTFKKEGSNEPDFTLYVTEPKPKAEQPKEVDIPQ